VIALIAVDVDAIAVDDILELDDALLLLLLLLLLLVRRRLGGRALGRLPRRALHLGAFARTTAVVVIIVVAKIAVAIHERRIRQQGDGARRALRPALRTGRRRRRRGGGCCSRSGGRCRRGSGDGSDGSRIRGGRI
jgi:hypothetical protein